MIAKNFVLATAMIMFVAMSGQAYAGATISDTRYWPSEASSVARNPAQRVENTFYSAERPRGIEAAERSYQGGPKDDY